MFGGKPSPRILPQRGKGLGICALLTYFHNEESDSDQLGDAIISLTAIQITVQKCSLCHKYAVQPIHSHTLLELLSYCNMNS